MKTGMNRERALSCGTRYPVRRNDGSLVKFDRNAIGSDHRRGNPRGTRIFGGCRPRNCGSANS
ncbi:UNVERIFIED_CONTAM: hypothetical protein GTU68_045466 [Idotea baltica]|nr:hypothetical protein [Idotea baltica]